MIIASSVLALTEIPFVAGVAATAAVVICIFALEIITSPAECAPAGV